MSNRNIKREGNRLIIQNMRRLDCVNDFVRVLYDGRLREYDEFEVYLKKKNTTVFPDACVPISAIMEFYKQQGIRFNLHFDEHEYLYRCHFENPQYLSKEEIELLDNPFDKIVKYDTPAQVAAFTQKCIDSISQQTICEEGIFESLIWCINEVMDNVLVHSQGKYGFVMAQLHPASKHIAICVSDTGIGIFNSLKTSVHHPRTVLDALSLAIQEGIGDGQGQGNGLYGLMQIIKSNGGKLAISSGAALLTLAADGTLQKRENFSYISRQNQGTIVDFQLDLTNKVDIKSAFSSIGGFDGFDVRIDDMIQKDDSLLYDVFANCKGTATREAGRLLRNDIMNTITRTNSKIVLDFSRVTTVSSSFIDELIAKMILELGLISFNQLITILNMNDTVKFLCERSTYMRIFEEWSKRPQT